MELTMRELKGKDIFVIMNLMNKLDIINPIKEMLNGERRDEILAMFKEESSEDEENTEEQIGLIFGIDIMSIVIERIPKAETDINQFLANLCGVETNVIESLSILEYVGLIKDFFGHSDLKAILNTIFSSSETKKTKKKTKQA